MASLPSASLFSLPLPFWHQPPSARAGHSRTRKRRRGSENWDQSDYGDGETTDAASVTEADSTGSALILSPDEARQYRVAGLPFNQEIPTGFFPHGPPPAPEGSKRVDSQAQLIKELSELSPPLYPPQSVAQQGNLRLKHLAVLTAILHRSLLEGDFIRAGRAWGLLLREEYAGYAIDVRHEGRWGIGAEILLRRDRQISRQSAERALIGGERKPPPLASHDPLFTRKGFENAKEYYERLIVQHPYRKMAPDAVSSLHFYTAMFGLWVYVVQEESTAAARHPAQGGDESSEDEDNSDTEEASIDGGDRGVTRKSRRVVVTEIKQEELNQANQIAARMDEILVSPPFSDSSDLLELRGMVSLWIGDLFISSLPRPGQREQPQPVTLDEEDMLESLDSIQARREQRLATDKRQAEIQKAKLLFEKARMRSRSMASSLGSLHIDDTLLDF